MKTIITTSLTLAANLVFSVAAQAQITGWEKPITSKLTFLQTGIIVLGISIAGIAFVVGIIKAVGGRGGMDSWKLPLVAIAVGFLVAISQTLFAQMISLAT